MSKKAPKIQVSGRVLSFLKRHPSTLEAETIQKLRCSRTEVREARKVLGIDRSTARAHVVKLLRRRPSATAAEMIAVAHDQYGVKFDPPDISRARRIALAGS